MRVYEYAIDRCAQDAGLDLFYILETDPFEMSPNRIKLFDRPFLHLLGEKRTPRPAS